MSVPAVSRPGERWLPAVLGRRPTAALLLLAATLLIWNLGGYGLWESTEARYAEIAAAIGQPKAVRAVGTANGDNHVAVLIPCHRVIRSDGTLGGYAGGLDRKRKLLAAEGLPERAPELPLVD